MGALMDRRMPARALLLMVAASCALLLALPGQTVTTRYLNDLFVILDGAYRAASGLVPSRDFHTPLGPLAYYLPAAGYILSGSLGGAMPAAMALATLALSGPMLHILGSRLHPILALLFGTFLLLILAVPINLGEEITSLSFAKFYNRIGWAALSMLLVMHLHPTMPRERQNLLDILCAASLTLVMIYTKATYGVVAAAFLIFAASDRDQRQWALAALGAVVLACLIVESVWQSSLAYFSDLKLALDVGGYLRGTWGQIADHILVNMTDYVLLGMLAFLALRCRPSARDALFYLFCAVTGFLIINQNFQAWGIVILHAASVVCAEIILRAEAKRAPSAAEGHWSVSGGATLLVLALVAPTIVHCAAALGLHTISSSLRAGEPIALPHLERVRLANLWTWGEYDAARPYLQSLQDGVDALSGIGLTDERIAALDFGNPFPMILGMPPPKGDMPWLQWERTLDRSRFVSAESLLADVDVVMEPKPDGDTPQATGAAELRSLYGAYLSGSFEIAQETNHWTIYRRRSRLKPEAALKRAEAL